MEGDGLICPLGKRNKANPKRKCGTKKQKKRYIARAIGYTSLEGRGPQRGTTRRDRLITTMGLIIRHGFFFLFCNTCLYRTHFVPVQRTGTFASIIIKKEQQTILSNHISLSLFFLCEDKENSLTWNSWRCTHLLLLYLCHWPDLVFVLGNCTLIRRTWHFDSIWSNSAQ
jgi:hypothetical protein